LKLLVTHPGRQHSHQAALGLQRAGLLAGYWAGVPALAEHGRGVPRSLWRRFIQYAPVPLAPAGVRWAPWVPALRRLGDRLLPMGAARRADFQVCRAFDRWVAARLRGSGAGAVIACEISALATFRAARELGITTILDAPSIHHLAQDRLHGTSDSPDLHRRIAQVKDGEIALADHILTVSELARRTYLDAGVPPEKVHALPLGADTGLFHPAEDGEEDGFAFLFAGAAIHRKGFDLLLDAFARVAAEEPEARLRIVGPRGDASHLLREHPRISVAGPTDQQGLAVELRRAGCLVLPSRNDSYAMVVAEALASGVPVLVSEMVGAKDLVREGKNGWVVPVEDAGALAGRMLWCVRHRDEVRAMRDECRRSAEAATWPAYHQRLAALMRSILREKAA
jgi:glycosyltransferase involved in cell wall biosynthesis